MVQSLIFHSFLTFKLQYCQKDTQLKFGEFAFYFTGVRTFTSIFEMYTIKKGEKIGFVLLFKNAYRSAVIGQGVIRQLVSFNCLNLSCTISDRSFPRI